MKTKAVSFHLAIALAFISRIHAQEVLPKPEQAFTDAKIGHTYKDSQPGTMVLALGME